jgi:arylsulfatase A-like enzyme
MLGLGGATWSGLESRGGAVQRPSRDDLPNVILISIDSLRRDHLGCYGYSRDTSAVIDRLAADGVLFTQALSTTSWTLPAHVSLLSGLAPEVHGVTDDGLRLGDGVVTLAQRLRQAGYLTAAFVSGPYLHAEFGLSRGFDLYDDYTVYHGRGRQAHSGVTSPRINRATTAWVEANAGRSLFLFVHYWDVHYDYSPPPPYDTLFDPDYRGSVTSRNFAYSDAIAPEMNPRDLEHLIALYDGEIAFTDQHIGRLLDHLKELGVYERSVVIVTSDHGDEFFEHGMKGHRWNLFDETLTVPLVMRFPGDRWQGLRVDDQVQLVDIVPSILSLVGLARPDAGQGEDLMGVIRGESAVARSWRFADLEGRLKCVRNRRWKYVQQMTGSQTASLYDLERDPSEQIDVIQEEPDMAAALRYRLQQWMDAAEELSAGHEAERLGYPRGLEDQLKSLGYLE